MTRQWRAITVSQLTVAFNQFCQIVITGEKVVY
jgi:hypothetical protein